MQDGCSTLLLHYIHNINRQSCYYLSDCQYNWHSIVVNFYKLCTRSEVVEDSQNAEAIK